MSADRKKRERVTLPWAMTTDGIAKFMKAWKEADDARDFLEKNNLDKRQWLKCVDIAAKLRAKNFKMKVMKLHASALDDVDFDVLRKVAKELGMV